jgi:hypothetical protein
MEDGRILVRSEWAADANEEGFDSARSANVPIRIKHRVMGRTIAVTTAWVREQFFSDTTIDWRRMAANDETE